MLRIRDAGLDESHSAKLGEYQKRVDAGTYPERVETARRLFKQYNRRRNPTFGHVRQRLTLMCSGAKRCHYCEDSVADEVEHFRPKSLYPELTFVWTNYLLVCGRCNSSKGARFSVVAGRKLADVTRTHSTGIEPPALIGKPGLIDPRRENPLTYLLLDLVDTFVFLPNPELSGLEYDRARYTIDLLPLNQEFLLAARREAYTAYRARLAEYRALRDQGAEAGALRIRVEAIQSSGHPTVWHEMQRWHLAIPELNSLFTDVPEALGWR